MTVGQLAREAGVNIETVRFYERRGLMPKPSRREVRNQMRKSGGGRGIRTPGTLPGTAVFKTARFNHSRIPP